MKKKNIGEGGYGCVHTPSVKCVKPPSAHFNYSNYVSKILETREAEKELAEFEVIGKLDPYNEYHLGQPVICVPDIVDLRLAEKCDVFDINEIIERRNTTYSLLLLKYGGTDLKKLCTKKLKPLMNRNKQNVARFWVEAHRLFMGLKMFKDNGMVHYDIKPHNILFNPKTFRMNYIDFGLMSSKKEIVERSKTSRNSLGIYHWSYPFGCGFLNKDLYDIYQGYTEKMREKYVEELSDIIINNATYNSLSIPIKSGEGFSILFAYLNPNGKDPPASVKQSAIYKFFNGFNNLVNNSVYKEVLELLIDTIDVFGLGLSLQYILNCFYRNKLIDSVLFSKLSMFFSKMYDFNPEVQIVDINYLINEYELLLMELGFLTQLQVQFIDNKIISVSTSEKNKTKELSKSRSKSIQLSPKVKGRGTQNIYPLKQKVLSQKLEQIALLDPQPLGQGNISTYCSNNQVINPYTNECVDKCADNYIRNSKFECKLIKDKSTKSLRPKNGGMRKHSKKKRKYH
jgi:serine/threonine protein kinase